MEPSTSLLESICNHIGLPPLLPGREDSAIHKIERELTERLYKAARTLRDLTNDQFGSEWECVCLSLQTCMLLNGGGNLSKSSLLKAFRELDSHSFLILHVAEQNAGLLIKRQKSDQGENVLFEAFEASPLSEKVLESTSALLWDFPGSAVTLPSSTFDDSSFQYELADLLEKASRESIKRFAAHTKKAGSFAYESRDTVDPSFITQMLMTLLEVNGTRAYPPILRKRVRDDVCWSNGAENPWRRCPFWLVLRVSLQRHLSIMLGEKGRMLYKFLICMVLSHLLDDILSNIKTGSQALNPELVVFLKTKLCRRLVKLEKDAVQTDTGSIYDYMFTTLEPLFVESINTATEYLDKEWNAYRGREKRTIPRLPLRATPNDRTLKLHNSYGYLQQILAESLCRSNEFKASTAHSTLSDHPGPAAIPKRGSTFVNHHFLLAEMETNLKREQELSMASNSSYEDICLSQAQNIQEYLNAVADYYDHNPQQKSAMLLTVMDLWISIDECATKLYPLLKDYSTGFPVEILDALHLPRVQDMYQVQKILLYLRRRQEECKGSRTTIFNDPVKGCFAERYYNESRDSSKLQELHKRIETAAEVARTKKEQEWQRLRVDYENLVKEISRSVCRYYTNDYLVPIHDYRCPKCALQHQADNFRIRTLEHPLPSDTVEANAVVFELDCPNAFVSYRNVTWRILATLASTAPNTGTDCAVLLEEYQPLQPYMSTSNSGFCLASTTKSFNKAHYQNVRFPVGLDIVCYRNGLKFSYFDNSLKSWPESQPSNPSFAHHCRLEMPSDSPLSFLHASPGFAQEIDGPYSSYSIVASQVRCPAGLNIHEFMAYKSLFSGKARRWPQILIELGSANINFGTEATVLLMSHLALQVGPARINDPLGTVHEIFRDVSFSKRLLGQLKERLQCISSSWRETNCMEIIITFILRICSLGVNVYDEAVELLKDAQTVTYGWVLALRSEVHMARDTETSQRCSEYALWAALLCKRTFSLYAEDDTVLAPAALQRFIECSIALQDNINGDPATLPSLLRNALIRDINMVHRLESVLDQSLFESPQSVMSAIATVWPGISGEPSGDFPRLEFLPEWWILIRTASAHDSSEQIVHFNMREGHLLVEGQPVAKLPAEFQQAEIIKRMFGNQRLLVCPSNLAGMAYMLPVEYKGYQVHFGLRNGNLVIRACKRNTVLQLIPPEIFGDEVNFDLPAALVENCAHWLDLKTGIIEIRPCPDFWKRKEHNNWHLNIRDRSATRESLHLVCPHSPLFENFATIFDKFEYPYRLTVYHRASKSLVVNLRRLELSFFVNSRGLLESNQLRSEIDFNQDAGTWFGLRSKIVLVEVTQYRDPVSRRQCSISQRQRSIIVPMGGLFHRRHELHVKVDVANDGTYARFMINEVLGRLECPAEPRLLYLKAQFHAYTSFVLPDPLTGRTGTEEALHCLKAGSSQPWTSLAPNHTFSLDLIAKLTPRREYYPKGRKVMQQTSWDPTLTISMQHDGYLAIVNEIYSKSAELDRFSPVNIARVRIDCVGDEHLNLRNSLRREVYQRPNAASGGRNLYQDSPYESRDCLRANQERLNVIASASLIRDWPSEMHTTRDLAGILQKWSTIGGYSSSFGKILLSDLLDVDLKAEWGRLINTCRNFAGKDIYRFMFLFAIMSFHREADMDALRILIAFGILEDLKALHLPDWSMFVEFRYNEVPRLEDLMQLIQPCLQPYGPDERSTLGFNVGSKLRRKLEAAERNHEKLQEKESRTFVESLLLQWPRAVPSNVCIPEAILLDEEQAMTAILPEWLRLFQNFELTQHVSEVQHVLDSHRAKVGIHPPNSEIKKHELLPTRMRGGEFPTLSEMMGKTDPAPPTADHKSLALSRSSKSEESRPVRTKDEDSGLLSEKTELGLTGKSQTQAKLTEPPLSCEIEELQQIVDGMNISDSLVRQKYSADLQESLDALKKVATISRQKRPSIDPKLLPSQISKAEHLVKDQLKQLVAAFKQNDRRAQWLVGGSMFPSVTPVTILEMLRSTSTCVFGLGMRENVINYALSITDLQRLIRMDNAHRKGNKQKVDEEQENEGHSNWMPIDRPDWILLEIDANMLIRPGQVDVAIATISPASESNSVLQMNMGQGKTSCIMPMAAAILADGKQLLRIVVPKPLLLQTAQLLVQRLGGLLGRELRHVPFSRKTPTTEETIEAFDNIHLGMQYCSGVMLALPEHLLSFKLSGLQQLSDSRTTKISEASPQATRMIEIQEWMTKSCRDILDECDSILSLRTQLIYPSGSQKTVDGHPYRWEIAEGLFKLVESHLVALQASFPRGIEVNRHDPNVFPTPFFLSKEVENALLSLLVKDICNGRHSILPEDLGKADRRAIKRFISQQKVSALLAEHIHHILPDKPAARQAVYLLRGLLVHRILLMTLKKRWNVQYGLHPSRDPLAVPYSAKGIPSEQAEFGHPDVAICLTILSFYYGGINPSQLRQTLDHVVGSDDPAQVYDRLSQESHLPDSLRDWTSINVEDESQLNALWERLRYNVSAIDYFLNKFVFPRHAKQFSTRLQSSAWDIPQFSPGIQASRGVGALTTGFSGTNDWKRFLPLNIVQHDLPGFAHTNAEVLTYLLQQRNREVVAPTEMLSERGLLDTISKKKIRVLIDAGAQVLALNNFDLAKLWLEICQGPPAVVYFGEDNKAWVLYRHGIRIPLLATPFADDLSECLVYLDEAHTRGTDLKLAANARGALTLGLGQTKDHTVQAAMRLRQLATTQSILFYAPSEVSQSIRDLSKKEPDESIDSHDVICWLLLQTISSIEQLQPLYFSQGVDFCRRVQAGLDNAEFLTDSVQRGAYLDTLQNREQQTLKQMYTPRQRTNYSKIITSSSQKIVEFWKELDLCQRTFHDTGDAVHATALQEVEQEREVAYEVEVVEEVQRPSYYAPLSYPGLHKDIINFVKTGKVFADSAGYDRAFVALRRTASGQKNGINSECIRSKLYVSTEFGRTVRLPVDQRNDSFQRPVNWILFSIATEAALIVIPEEAEEIISRLSSDPSAVTYLLTYAAPITKKMLHFNDLTYYAIPNLPSTWEAPMWLKVELGVFAGRLYFDYGEYEQLCHFLGIRNDAAVVEVSVEDLGTPVRLDGADDDDDDYSDEELGMNTSTQNSKVFARNPLAFLQDWLALKRKGQDFKNTPMGYMCQGKKLDQNHSFFSSLATVKTEEGDKPNEGQEGDESSDDDGDEAPEETEVDEENLFDGTGIVDEGSTFDDSL